MNKTVPIETEVSIIAKAFKYSGTMDEDTWHLEMARLAVKALRKAGFEIVKVEE